MVGVITGATDTNFLEEAAVRAADVVTAGPNSVGLGFIAVLEPGGLVAEMAALAKVGQEIGDTI